VTLTTEKADLEKEIADLMKDIEDADTLRTREAGEFANAKDEMEKAIAALNKAIQVLGTATSDHTGGVLLDMRVNEGFAARTKEAQSLQYAVDLGKKFLSKGDALFLQRLMTGDVPDVDWKKLNRKASFKMSYKARSFKIQEVLAQIKATFVENLSTATEKESTAISEHTTLSSAKNGQLVDAQGNYQNMAGENGARGQSKQDTEDEISRLQTQVSNDLRFISEITSTLAAKKIEWKDRQKLRAGEVEAIAKAIEILYNDDARDNFKKSFASQNFFFLQTRSETSAPQRAAEALRETGRKAHDHRLVALAAEMSRQFPTFGPAPAPAPAPKTEAIDRSAFANVLSSIDTMVSTLKIEMDNDLAEKETCEKERAENARSAIVASRDIDDKTDHIAALKGEIADLTKSIEDAQAELKLAREEDAEAGRIRGEENTEWQKTDGEDQLAKTTVNNAKNVLANFYSDNNLMLTQTAKVAKKQVPAGEAPPPPPSTFEDPYGGKTGESTGIIAILTMIAEDIQKDITKAKAEEDASQSAYNTQYATFESEESALLSSIISMGGTKGGKTTEVTSTEGLRDTKKTELDGYMTGLQDDLDTGCEFMTIHYEARYKNRQFEIDGLTKAKAILQGAAFSNVDPNRAIVPGDALLLAKGRGRLH